MKKIYFTPELKEVSFKPQKPLCGGYYSTPRSCSGVILILILCAVGLYCIF